MPELPSLIKEYSLDLIEKIKDAYLKKKELISTEGTFLYLKQKFNIFKLIL